MDESGKEKETQTTANIESLRLDGVRKKKKKEARRRNRRGGEGSVPARGSLRLRKRRKKKRVEGDNPILMRKVHGSMFHDREREGGERSRRRRRKRKDREKEIGVKGGEGDFFETGRRVGGRKGMGGGGSEEPEGLWSLFILGKGERFANPGERKGNTILAN